MRTDRAAKSKARNSRFRSTLLFSLLLLPFFSTAEAATNPGSEIDFGRDIRPILSDNCFKCHGPDDKERKAKLRFDVKEDAFKPAKSGALAIVAGEPEKSELIVRIMSKDEDDVMPPAKSGKKLTSQQIDLLTRWIKQGAKWQSHWAYVKPERPSTPATKNRTWARNEIDQFVLARLEKETFKPSPEAEKTTLIRRATLDLTGLPPTVTEVDAFLSDSSAGAYDKLVDRLLNSPKYGEEMARSWLDAARYADSHGYHIDSDRSMWRWRDWVIDSFNKDLPFDQFTIEQLAGDLLPTPTLDQKIASGYVRCNMSTGEGGAIEDEYLAKYTFDRVETTGAIWMGLTLTCARCHTHKYDPITHHEYYGLYSFFHNLNESIMDGNKPNPDPFIKLPSPEQAQRQAWLKDEINTGQTKLDAPMPELDSGELVWRSKWQEKLSAAWTLVPPLSVKSTATNSPEFKILSDQSVLVEGPNPEQDVHEVLLKPAPGDLSALRLEVLPDGSLPKSSGARAEDGQFRLGEIQAELIPPKEGEKEPEPKKLKFKSAIADSSQKDHEIGKAIDGNGETGWGVETNAIGQSHAALFVLNEPVKIEPASELRVRLRYEASKSKRAIGRFRLALAQDQQLVRLLHPPKSEPWHVLGPFKSESLQAGLAKIYEPEKEIDLKKSYPGVREEIKWTAQPDYEDGKSHLLVNELHGVHGAYYLHRILNVPSPRRIDLSVRADEVFRLWLNDQIVAERTTPEKPGEGPLRLTVELKAGENRLLLKIVTQVGASHFTFNRDSKDADTVPSDVAAILALNRAPSNDDEKKVRYYYRRQNSPEYLARFEQVEKWRGENSDIEKAIPTTMVAKEMEKSRDTFMLIRGEYDKKGEKVTPGVPSILPPLPKDAPTNRLGFAQWLVDPSHPLTARVAVNRFWQHYFGIGLVKTPEDFGVQGERPSHPELLDWLATEFIASGWDVKHLQRLIVTSATYRQSSRLTPELLAKDPENRLLTRGPRFRVEAEVVRDTVLAVGGLLVDREGGQSAKPYQPPGLWEAVSFNNSQKYVPDVGEGQYRRSLYTYWKRQSPPPSMLIFDAPTREYCVMRRPRTNTPLQALAAMNDPQFIEASRALAQRMVAEGGNEIAGRIAYGFRIATARKPDAGEIRVLQRFLDQQLAEFRKDKEAAEKLNNVGGFKTDCSLNPAELAAWTTLANLILNLDETLTKS